MDLIFILILSKLHPFSCGPITGALLASSRYAAAICRRAAMRGLRLAGELRLKERASPSSSRTNASVAATSARRAASGGDQADHTISCASASKSQTPINLPRSRMACEESLRRDR